MRPLRLNAPATVAVPVNSRKCDEATKEAVYRRNQAQSPKSCVHPIWRDVDWSAYQSSEIDQESSSHKPEILSRPVPAEFEANDMVIEDKALNREPSAPSSVGIVKASGFHYVQVYNNGAQHALIGPFRTLELAQGEATKWIARFQLESQQ